jgi:hypothetical protein
VCSPFTWKESNRAAGERKISIPDDPGMASGGRPPGSRPCDSLGPMVLQIVGAIVLFLVVAFVGVRALRAVSGPGHGGEVRPADAEPEDVADLDVFLVCRECGTEFQVTRLGEVQVPRHCGERMEVVRRPAGQAFGGPSLN